MQQEYTHGDIYIFIISESRQVGKDVEPRGQPGDADRVPGEGRLSRVGHLCQPAGPTHTH